MRKFWTESEIMDFLHDEDNILNCEECPYNRGFDDFQHRLPCGQYHCWIDLHCTEQKA